MSRLTRLLLLGCVLLAAGCQGTTPTAPAETPAGPPWFRDVTDEVGLDFVHDAGPTGHFFMPQIMGAGAALIDYDNDGRLDILLLQSAGPDAHATNRLYHQEANGHFTDVSKGSGLDVAGYATGVAVGDVNNDGWPDVVIAEFGALRLFLNNGNGTFREVTHDAGLDSVLWGTSVSFVDYDRDGWLDLVVVNYVVYDPSRLCYDALGRRDYCHPSAFPSAGARLYHNLGKAGGKGVRFEDVTDKAGLGRLKGPGLGVVCADFDGDGWPDLLVANDGQPNQLWINHHDGTFTEEAASRGLACNTMGQAQANMGIALGDVDGNGLFDVFITHLTEETNTLWCQEPRGLFRDRTPGTGLTAPPLRGTGFGVVLADFDQDGTLDLGVVNGRVRLGKPLPGAALGTFWNPYAERNHLFAGAGAGRFRDLSASNPALCGEPGIYRGLAQGDVDGDGAVDLLVTAVAGRARLYRNVAPNRGHWLLVRALDPALHRDAYGAEVRVTAGDRTWLGWVNPAGSYECSSDPRAHFGLGPAERVERIEVRWPDGSDETFEGGAADRVVVLHKGEGKKGTR
jgi:hypothetical protein